MTIQTTMKLTDEAIVSLLRHSGHQVPISARVAIRAPGGEWEVVIDDRTLLTIEWSQAQTKQS